MLTKTVLQKKEYITKTNFKKLQLLTGKQTPNSKINGKTSAKL
jgi:hypothetical protein